MGKWMMLKNKIEVEEESNDDEEGAVCLN